MDLQVDKKHIIGYTCAICLSALATWYICASVKGVYFGHLVTEKTQQLSVLQDKVYNADIEISKLSGELKVASEKVIASKKTAEEAQKRTNDILAKYDGTGAKYTPYAPTSKPSDSLEDTKIAYWDVSLELNKCNDSNIELHKDNEVLVTEVKADRVLIGSLDNENSLLKTKDATLEKEVSDLKEVSSQQVTIISDKDKQIEVEKTKTSIWKKVAAGAVVVAVALLI